MFYEREDEELAINIKAYISYTGFFVEREGYKMMGLHETWTIVRHSLDVEN